MAFITRGAPYLLIANVYIRCLQYLASQDNTLPARTIPSTLALSGRERAGWAVSNDLHPSFKNMSVKRIGESVGVACVELPVHHHIIESACCMFVSMMLC